MKRTRPLLLALPAALVACVLGASLPAAADKPATDKPVADRPAADKAPAGKPGGPLAQVQKTNERIEKLLHSKKSADDPAARAEMRAIAEAFLDYDELSRRSLSSKWDKLTAPQRTDFTKTLKEMIEKNYEKRLRTDLDYKIKYGEEKLTGDDALVTTTVKLKTKGKSTEAGIDYKLHKGQAGWLVYDVVTDEVSMVKNYREQFEKIINQESFDALLKKMRKRIQEIDDNKKTAANP